jgi:hypothetical protein
MKRRSPSALQAGASSTAYEDHELASPSSAAEVPHRPDQQIEWIEGPVRNQLNQLLNPLVLAGSESSLIYRLCFLFSDFTCPSKRRYATAGSYGELRLLTVDYAG